MEKSEEENGGRKMKSMERRKARLIIRLGEFLISHSVLASVISCAAGIVVLFLLPVLAKKTYISENALMPGSANPMFSQKHVMEADKLVKAITDQIYSTGKELETPRLIAQYMSHLGAEVYYHKFEEETKQFHPFHFFSSIHTSGSVHGNGSTTALGINTVGIIRAPRGDGKESIVMVSPYNSQKLVLDDAVSLGLAYSVFSLLSQATWLAKDIVWVASDSRYGEYVSVDAWLREYHNPSFLSEAVKVDSDTYKMCIDKNMAHNCKNGGDRGSVSDDFRRAGTMAAGLVLKVTDQKQTNERDSLKIYSEASNGQMPNLDLVNIVYYLAVQRQSFHVKVGIIRSLLSSVFLKTIGKTLEILSEMVGYLNPKWKFGISAADYVEGSATLASSMYTQALGVPTGSHGAFRDYQVDAITLEFSPSFPFQKDLSHSLTIINGGRLIEGVIRSVNNLLEKFHQSFFLYFFTSPDKFISVGVYMIGFALLAAPLPIVASALFSGKFTSEDHGGSTVTEKTSNSPASWQWIGAAKVVFTVHIWAIIVLLMPHFISQLPNLTSTMSMLIWISNSTITALFFYMVLGSPYQHSNPQHKWLLLKAVMISATSIGLSLMSIINFATVQIGSLFLVPMCLIAQPLRCSKPVLLTCCNLLFMIIGFPLFVMLIFESLSTEFEGICIGNFWEWTQSLWEWNSATYLYLLVIHLPCWVLFMHILFHP